VPVLVSVSLLGRTAPDAQARALAGCPAGGTLSVVAHQDDSILFQDPDLRGEIANGKCVRTVFVTAGDAGLDSNYWQAREAGAKAAYADLAGQPLAWHDTDAGIPGHPAPLLTLDGNPRVSIVFLRLPDGQSAGRGFGSTGMVSLEKLWMGAAPAAAAVDKSSTYTRDDLTRALLSVMTTFGPDTIRTQDFVGTFGDGDHSDHHATALFTKAASEQYLPAHKLVAYADYAIGAQPKNLAPVHQVAKEHTFFVYAAYDPFVCHAQPECEAAGYLNWWSRQYVLRSLDQGSGPPPVAEIAPPPPPAPAVKSPAPSTKPPVGAGVAAKGQRLKRWCRSHRGSPRCAPFVPRRAG
jgi:LmbE family N-acetylglucosaminyl deacetylase